MKNFLRKKFGKIILIILGLFLFLVILWYFFGDNLFLTFLKWNSEEKPCHEDCMAERMMIYAGLSYLSENRPWTTNKIKSEILNQKEPGKYRALVLDVYRQIIGEGKTFPKEILNLLNDSKTPPEVKEAIISYSSDLEPTAEMIEQWKNIAADENQGVDARVAAIRKIGETKNEEFAEFLLDIVKNTKEGRIQFEAITETKSILIEKELGQEIINNLKGIFFNTNIHPSIKEFVLEIFAFSKNKDFAKDFLSGIYNDNKDYDKFLRFRAAELLDYLVTGELYGDIKIYPRPEISDKEWNDYGEEIAKIIF